jgi:hypothetical protein
MRVSMFCKKNVCETFSTPCITTTGAQLAHIKSFDAVARDSDAIMTALRTKLRASVRDTRTGSIAQVAVERAINQPHSQGPN